MNIYNSNKEEQKQALKTLKRKLNVFSFFRFLSIMFALISGYSFYQSSEQVYLYFIIAFVIGFLILLRYYDKISQLKKHKEAIVAINEDELSFLNNNKIPFDDGLEFHKEHHEYAYDLDIFGNKSLFQNLNRTNTFIGKQTLATTLLTQLSNDEILENQEAIKELAEKLSWRQDFMAHAKLSNDKEVFYKQLIAWSAFNSKKISKVAVVLSYLLPTIFVVLVLMHNFTNPSNLFPYLVVAFIANLTFASQFFKRIKLENSYSTDINKIIKQYSLMIESIENESFKSGKLTRLQKELQANTTKASVSFRQLSRLFSMLDSANNPIVAVLLNGCFLYHIHGLKALIHWKTEKAKYLENWLTIIGEFEMLGSLANFSYNNPTFVFPKLNNDYDISFTEMSHPLLNANRVANTISFQPQSFIILTGSNMSGKSTFLRSLGVNMVLAGIGSIVCASKASIHPMPILVSMRLSDSLADSESYFYAEIKRLKQIMDVLKSKRSFVLLDEILRGTNSDDKRSGTVAVIQKMVAQKAIGAIATHDIEVCLITNDNPEQLINKCFEAEIDNDDLHFDYKLRDGICKNKSATFLMQKIGVIDKVIK